MVTIATAPSSSGGWAVETQVRHPLNSDQQVGDDEE